MAEVPVYSEVEVEGENGDGKGRVEESRTSEGVNGICSGSAGNHLLVWFWCLVRFRTEMRLFFFVINN